MGFHLLLKEHCFSVLLLVINASGYTKMHRVLGIQIGYLFTYLSVSQSVRLSVRLSIHSSVRPSVSQSASQPASQSVSQMVSLFPVSPTNSLLRCFMLSKVYSVIVYLIPCGNPMPGKSLAENRLCQSNCIILLSGISLEGKDGSLSFLKCISASKKGGHQLSYFR